MIRNGVNVNYEVEEGSSGKKYVMDIISDMRLTDSSLDSKEALTNIDKVYMDYVTSNLHASMCEKNKLRVYRELKEVFECKKYLYGVPDMGSKLLFRFRSGTHGLNEELGRHITRNVSKACVFCNCDCESVEHVLWSVQPIVTMEVCLLIV